MRLALLGEHPDGLELARALAATGRHELAVYQPGSSAAAERWPEQGLDARVVTDIEEILADPAIEMLIVAGHLDIRPAQLRRGLQSERAVLCVYPPDDTADMAYEASMIQADTKHLLLPIMSSQLHPALGRLADMLRASSFDLIQIERRFPTPDEKERGRKLWLPDWPILRRLGGEIVEVSGFGREDTPSWAEPLVCAGAFESRGLFQLTLLPGARSYWRLRIVGEKEAELEFAGGWSGPARLTWTEDGAQREESWEPWQGAGDFVKIVEAALTPADKTDGPTVSWQDAIRCQELDDALRRSVAKRRASLLDYQEASEEVGFKGTMTLVGCALLWMIMLLAILSAWQPWLGWLVIPALVVFLGLQLLRWIIPRRD